VTVDELLQVKAQASTEELVNRINAYASIQTFSAQADVYVYNYFTGHNTKADKFPQVSGLIRFQRPENTRMRVTFPLPGYSKEIADMVSDGQNFRLALYYPDDKRRFIKGSNLKELDRINAEELSGKKDPDIKAAGGLVNMRPQHFTESFLIKSVGQDERSIVVREEVNQTEPHPQKKNQSVQRPYYVLYVLEQEGGRAKLRRKFWFDRSQVGAPLVRQQIFENGEGRLAGDITYSDWFQVASSQIRMPGKVRIDRRSDGYRLELTLEKESSEVNVELPATTFVLMNDKNLAEVDLDAPRKASADTTRKPQAHLPAHR
jgi:hypothetical protein